VGEGVPGVYPHAKLHGCGFKDVGLQAQKSPKWLIFGINLPKKSMSPSAIFFTKFGVGREFQACTHMPNFTVVTFKMWAYSPQNSQNC